MSKIDDMVAAGRSALSAPYHFWGGGALEDCSPEYMNCSGADANYLLTNGVNCSGLINWMRTQAGLTPIGGTAAYGDWISPWWDYDPNATYPVGTLLVEPYVEGVSEGHIVMVSTDSQYILQATIPRGVNEDYTHADMNQYTPFSWAGYMPDCLPGDGPGPGSAQFDVDLLMKCYSNSLDRQTAEADLPYLLSGFREFEINTKQRIAAYLAVCSGESGELQYFAEIDPPASYGIYYGRGMIGVTFVEVYQHFADGIGDQSIMSNPYQLEQPPMAIRSGCWFWREGSAWGNLNGFADQGDFASCMGGVYGAPDPPNADTRIAYYNWILSQLPDDVSVDGSTPEEEDLSFAKYCLAVIGEPGEDYADAALMALRASGIDAMVLNNAENILAASAKPDLATRNILVLNKAAHDALDPAAQAIDGWATTSAVWQLYGHSDFDPATDVLNGARNWGLGWVASYDDSQGSAKPGKALVDQFDASLLSIKNGTYKDALDKLEGTQPPPPPPPPITLDKLMAVKRTDLQDDDMVVILKRKA